LKIAREFKVGAITVITLASLYWGISFLKGQDLLSNKRIIYAEYEHVDGLSAARPVNINGLNVGRVHEIYFHPNGSGNLMVSINLTNDIQIPINSVASITSDLLGSTSIELVLGDSKSFAAEGDTLESKIKLSLSQEVNEQVRPIKEKAEKLIGSIDTVMILASAFLNEETSNSFRQTFGKLQETVNRLSNAINVSEQSLINSVDNLGKITGTIEQNRGELDAIFKNLATLTDSLSRANFGQVLANLDTTLMHTSSVMSKIDSSSGSASALLNERELYDNLLAATEQLNLILLDLKYNPKRYVHFSLIGGSDEYNEQEIKEKEAEAKEKREAEIKK
jgi:phospholipid/cholesterol/gamma-HCH transport system substrate-binding protein